MAENQVFFRPFGEKRLKNPEQNELSQNFVQEMSQSCTERAKSGSSYRKRRNPVRNGVADWQKHCGTAAGLIPKPAATAGSAAWSFHRLHLRFRCCQSTSCSQILLIIHGPTYAQNNKRAHWGQSGTR